MQMEQTGMTSVSVKEYSDGFSRYDLNRYNCDYIRNLIRIQDGDSAAIYGTL